MGLGKLFKGIHKAVKKVGGAVAPPGLRKKKEGSVGPSDGMMNKLSAGMKSMRSSNAVEKTGKATARIK